MLAALAPDDLGYRLLLLLHLLAVVSGFGSMFVYPPLGRVLRQRGQSAAAVSAATLDATNRISMPSIFAAAVFGIALVAVSDFKFSEAWISIAFGVFIAIAAVAAVLYVPNLRRIDALAAGGQGPAEEAGATELDHRVKRSGMYIGLIHLGFLVLMVDMIWKPGA